MINSKKRRSVIDESIQVIRGNIAYFHVMLCIFSLKDYTLKEIEFFYVAIFIL